VLVAAAAVLDEELGVIAVEEAITLLGEVTSGAFVEAVVIELVGVAKCSTAKEEVESVADDIMVGDEVGIGTVEEKTMLLECVDSCGFFGGSDIL
jgi:hypothetical protein